MAIPSKLEGTSASNFADFLLQVSAEMQRNTSILVSCRDAERTDLLGCTQKRYMGTNMSLVKVIRVRARI